MNNTNIHKVGVRRKSSVVLSLILLLSLGFLTARIWAGRAPFPSELIWGDDELYKIFGTKIPVPGAPASQEPFFIIGTVGVTQSTYGPFDHVISIPAHNKGEFSAIWHIYWLELGPNALLGVNVQARFTTTPFGATAGQDANFVYAADLSGTGALVPLTSYEKVEEAISLGLARAVDSGITFTCPVVPAFVSP